jgi:hypothetical protein
VYILGLFLISHIRVSKELECLLYHVVCFGAWELVCEIQYIEQVFLPFIQSLVNCMHG